MTGDGESLLHCLWKCEGCSYLSDLRLNPRSAEKLLPVVRRISAGQFSSEQWREALTYLTGEAAAETDSAACLRSRLLARLEGRTA